MAISEGIAQAMDEKAHLLNIGSEYFRARAAIRTVIERYTKCGSKPPAALETALDALDAIKYHSTELWGPACNRQAAIDSKAFDVDAQVAQVLAGVAERRP